MRKTYFLVLIASLFFLGCAPKIKVYRDGYPLPNNTYYSRNIQTKMEVFGNVAKYYVKGEKDKKYLYPDWLDVGEEYGTFNNKIKYIGGHIKITNPNEVKYSVVVKRSNFENYILFTGSNPVKILEFKQKYDKDDKNSKIRVLVYRDYIDKISEKENLEDKLFDINLITYNSS